MWNCLDIVPVSNINVHLLSNTNRWLWFLIAIYWHHAFENCIRFLRRTNRTGYVDMVSIASMIKPPQHRAAADSSPYCFILSFYLCFIFFSRRFFLYTLRFQCAMQLCLASVFLCLLMLPGFFSQFSIAYYNCFSIWPYKETNRLMRAFI